jgi:hypothetical protein
MDDQEFINQLAEKLSKLGTVRPLGFHYLHPYGTVPADSIICNGATYSRALYKDFFDYITTQGWVKTEAEWQKIATRDNGFCPFYSSGDGSTNFRTPKFAPYQQIAMEVAQATTYHQAGIPNVEGSTELLFTDNNDGGTGVLRVSSGASTGATDSYTRVRNNLLSIDASRNSNVYGASDTVQPEAYSWVMCVVAYGIATNVGSVDIQNVMSAVNAVQANLEGIPRPRVYITETWESTDGTSWYRKWSDGWVEQGGRVNAVGYKDETQNVTFMVTMSNTNYFAVSNPLDTMHTAWDLSSRVSLLKMGGMTVMGSANINSIYTGECTWYVCGY